MPGVIQLLVCSGTQSWLIPIPQNAKVDDLFQAIITNCFIGKNPSKMRLMCGDKYLEYGNETCFKDYSLAHLSTIVVLLPICGGVLPHLDASKEWKTTVVPLRGFITVTSSYSEPDMITFDASPDEQRARMPCGHVIGPESMTGYCQSVLLRGEFKFYCPSVDVTGKANCNREWDYFLVRHVACLSADEMKEFEKKISDNYLKKASGIQTCPGCKTWCYKEDDTGNFVRCPLCNRDFCWACMRDWMRPSDSQLCGNVDCDGRDSRTRILATCPTKEIGQCPACPTARACPKCGILTEHKEACGHVTCPTCSYGFCFICLKGMKNKHAWRCSPGGICTLAKRQTSASFRAPASQPARQPARQPASQPANQLANQPASLGSWLERWLESWTNGNRDGWRCTIL